MSLLTISLNVLWRQAVSQEFLKFFSAISKNSAPEFLVQSLLDFFLPKHFYRLDVSEIEEQTLALTDEKTALFYHQRLADHLLNQDGPGLSFAEKFLTNRLERNAFSRNPKMIGASLVPILQCAVDCHYYDGNRELDRARSIKLLKTYAEKIDMNDFFRLVLSNDLLVSVNKNPALSFIDDASVDCKQSYHGSHWICDRALCELDLLCDTFANSQVDPHFLRLIERAAGIIQKGNQKDASSMIDKEEQERLARISAWICKMNIEMDLAQEMEQKPTQKTFSKM